MTIAVRSSRRILRLCVYDCNMVFHWSSTMPLAIACKFGRLLVNVVIVGSVAFVLPDPFVLV